MNKFFFIFTIIGLFSFTEAYSVVQVTTVGDSGCIFDIKRVGKQGPGLVFFPIGPAGKYYISISRNGTPCLDAPGRPLEDGNYLLSCGTGPQGDYCSIKP